MQSDLLCNRQSQHGPQRHSFTLKCTTCVNPREIRRWSAASKVVHRTTAKHELNKGMNVLYCRHLGKQHRTGFICLGIPKETILSWQISEMNVMMSATLRRSAQACLHKSRYHVSMNKSTSTASSYDSLSSYNMYTTNCFPWLWVYAVGIGWISFHNHKGPSHV